MIEMKNSSGSVKLARNIFILAFPFLVISCKESIPTGDIDGVVLFAGTIIPVGGVNVRAGEIAAISSEDGSFHLIGVTAGKQALTAEKPGFIPFSAEIDVLEGLNIMDIQMISPAMTSNVHGQITGDFTGNPQPGLEVIMLNPDGSESAVKATTIESGFYQLQHVPFGERTIIVKSENTRIFQESILFSTPDHSLDIIIPEPMMFTDQRDGKSYTARKIGTQIWMEANLSYLPVVCPPDWESDNLELYYVYGYHGTDVSEAMGTPNYSKYGVLYNWPAAMKACPAGWHLPSDNEWKILEIYFGMEPEDADQVRWRLTGAVGLKLKSGSGWESNGNGNNESGFSALPGGSRGNDDSFSGSGRYCNFWTGSLNVNSLPWNRFLSYDNNGVSRYAFTRTLGFSVRCVKDSK